jgi:putative CocE/NonD family hydrolase
VGRHPESDAYRDVTFHGGAVDAGFIPLWLGLTSSLSSLPPSTTLDDPAGSVPTWADHLGNAWDFAGQKMVDTTLGGDSAYDGPFYRLRSPGDRAAQIEVPVVIQGGWWDIFQRGEPLLYEQLTSSPNKKLFMSPHYHVDGGPTLEDPELKDKWFDHWLQGADNGVENTPPVNLYPIDGGDWDHYPTWPVPEARYTPAYLGGGKALTFSAPGQGGGDKAPLLPASSSCSRMTTQWTAGAAAGPCETDNRTWEASSLTYTSAPLEQDTKLTGPIVTNVWAELTSKDATLIGVLSDVAPSGESNQVTAGFLLASQRAVDAAKSTYDANGTMIRPYHPFTRESQQPVTPNDPALYQIEIYPTSAIFRKGDRIRLTIGSANTPATAAPLPALADSIGGDIRVLHGGRYASHVLLPVVPD